jgi:5-methylcytosine-specific restriction enzyme subunit McrC
MLAAARLACELGLPLESAGAHTLPLPDREERWVRRLFERAVGGFYKVALRPRGWRVRAGTPLLWPIERQTRGMAALLPGMRTDMILDHAALGRRVVIDTKFTSIVSSGWRREATLRSGHLYQMYAYLRSQEEDGALGARAAGVLLYPSVQASLDETVEMHGQSLRFMTVDLAGPASEVRRTLLRVCEPPDEGLFSPLTASDQADPTGTRPSVGWRSGASRT